MTDRQGDRRVPPSDPTAERTSDPVPLGDAVHERDGQREGMPPRRYEEDVDADRTVMPADDSTLNTKI